MKKLIVISMVIGFVLLEQGCSSEDDKARVTFEQAISNFKKGILGEEYWHLDNLSYDVQKTNSLITPFFGTVEIVLTEKASPTWAKISTERQVELGEISKEEAPLLQRTLEESGIWRRKYKIQLVFQNNKWEIEEAIQTERFWHKGMAEENPNQEMYLNKVNSYDAIYSRCYDLSVYDTNMNESPCSDLSKFKKWMSVNTSSAFEKKRALEIAR